MSASTLEYLQSALRGVATDGTARGLFADFPIPVSAKTGSGQVSGKDDTSWFASYAPSNDPQYAVVMMVSQGGTGAGTSGPGVKKIYEALFGVTGGSVNPKNSVLPGAVLPERLPRVAKDGTVQPPLRSAP
jgi:penicillin-binding protein 2